MTPHVEEVYGRVMLELSRREGHKPGLPKMPQDAKASARARAAKLKERVFALRDKGYSQRRIAEICHCAPSRVAQFFTERGW